MVVNGDSWWLKVINGGLKVINGGLKVINGGFHDGSWLFTMGALLKGASW